MKLKDQDFWDQQKRINTDPYGACVLRYAERWANMMEEKLGNPIFTRSNFIYPHWKVRIGTIPLIAEKTGYEADTEGITGFMYGW